MTNYNRAQEAASWREMQEILHEAYGVQELEGESSAGQSNGYSQRRSVNISTPMVVIRITLAPGRRPIFPARRTIADAIPARTPGATAASMPYVPVQAPVVAGTAPSPARGVVFLPPKGANQVHVATNSPAYAGDWVRRQAQVLPAFGQRIRRVQVLVDGKPCKTCVSSLVRNVQPVMPAGTRVNVRYTRPATASRLNQPVATLGSRPVIRYPQAPSASRPTSTGPQSRSPQKPSSATGRTTLRYPQAPSTGRITATGLQSRSAQKASSATGRSIRYPQSPAASALAAMGGQPRGAQKAVSTAGQQTIRYPKPPAAAKVNQQQRQGPNRSATPTALAATTTAPRQPNGRFATRQAPASPGISKPAAPRPAVAPANRPVAAPARTDKQQRESQSFLGALFGESGL